MEDDANHNITGAVKPVSHGASEAGTGMKEPPNGARQRPAPWSGRLAVRHVARDQRHEIFFLIRLAEVVVDADFLCVLAMLLRRA